MVAKELLRVEDLYVMYKTDMEEVHAVNGIVFTIREQETLGLVGETGAGKTSTALAILRLLPDRTGRIPSGNIWFQGKNILEMDHEEAPAASGRGYSHDIPGSHDKPQPCHPGWPADRRSLAAT